MVNQLPNVRLVDVDAANWGQVVDVAPRPDQDQFVAPVARYLCLAHYGGEWNPLAIESDGRIVGHVMWGIDEADGSTWLGGLVINAAAQGRGIGRAAIVAFLDRFTENGRTNIALSYSPDNLVVRKLYAALGFVETGEMEDDEIVARYQRS
ncbi:MAG: GNAT family N-acetyltransferase [Actinomycetota bacterium]